MTLKQTLNGEAELVVDPKTGEVRQAGADRSGDFVTDFRRRAEESLFVFAKGVLGLTRLTRTLHLPCCDWLQAFPPYRKLMLMPRDHLKTSMCRALVIHMLMQPKDNNHYRPGVEGASTRILLANETATNAEHQLRWIENQFETNQLLRALWPHRIWDNPRKQSKKWNEKEMTVRRTTDFPEASVETIGVGGAVTGRHYDVLVKDDLISVEAANSPLVMQTAVEWHKASRALMDDPDKSLEVIIGTRWAVQDLYDYIQTSDPSVECIVRSIVENGQPIFPEMFSEKTIARLQAEFGTLFPLLYMNSAADPELTDFDGTQIRRFTIKGDTLCFPETEADAMLRERLDTAALIADPAPMLRGQPLTPKNYDLLFSRNQELRLRSTRSS